MTSIEKQHTTVLSGKKMFANGKPGSAGLPVEALAKSDIPPGTSPSLLEFGSSNFSGTWSLGFGTFSKMCRISPLAADTLLNNDSGHAIASRLHRGQIPGRLHRTGPASPGLVHSAALRQVRSPQLAEEVSRSVFTDLARAAEKLQPNTILTAWLYQVTRRTAITEA
jgi:hypothetical protein